MKAIVIDQYGSKDELKEREVATLHHRLIRL